MRTKISLRVIALMMSILMLFSLCACGNGGNENTSVPTLNYGDEVIDDIVDDEDSVTIETEKENQVVSGDKGGDDISSNDTQSNAANNNSNETTESSKENNNSTSNNATNNSSATINNSTTINNNTTINNSTTINNNTTSSSTSTTSSNNNNTTSSSSTSTTSSNNNNTDKPVANSSNKDNTAESYDDNLDRNHVVDENKKKTLLESVPESLKGQEVSILTWWNPFEYEKKKMEKFTQETGIKIKWVYADIDNYTQRLASLRAQGNAPDIAAIRVQDYPSSIMQDYFRPLSESKLDISKKEVFDIDSMNLAKWEGEHYGAIIKGTTYITMGLLMYNADLFDKYGVTSPHKLWQDGKWNWDTFVSTAQDIQKKSKVVAVTAEYQGYRLAQTGGEDAVAIKNGKLVNNTSSKNYRDTYKWMTNLLPEGQYKIMDFGFNLDGFKSGKVAMFVGENWTLQAGERLNNLSFTLGYAPLPCKTNKTVVPSDFQLWGFPTGSKHLEAASYALEYWQDPAYNETGYDIWLNDSVASFNDWLWEQPKTFKISEGVIEYGGDYDWYSYNYEATESMEKVDSAMDKWSSVIDSNIKKIYAEFGS